MRHNILERLLFKGAIHSIGMGGGMGDDGGNKGGGRNGNNGDRGSSGGGRAGGNGGRNGPSMGGKRDGTDAESTNESARASAGRQNDNQATENSNSANRGGIGGGGDRRGGASERTVAQPESQVATDQAARSAARARAAMDRRAATVETEENAFSANRNMDAISGLANPDSMTESHKRDFSHATKAMTMDNKHSIADRHAADATGTVNSIASGLGMLGGPAGVAVASLGTAMNTAHSKVNAMEDLGVPQTAVDFGYETARGLIPGAVASKTAPIGARLGASVAGVPGAVVGGIATGIATKAGFDHAMNPANQTGVPSTSSNSVGDGAQVANSSINNARNALSTKQPTAIQAPSFGVADMDLNNYSSGLLTARV